MRGSFLLVGLTIFIDCNSQALSHQLWSQLLKSNVDAIGQVDYKNMLKDSILLNEYLQKLSDHPPNASWTANESKAYWINAYNAFTIQLVLRNYPVQSIKEIGSRVPFVNSSWDIPFIKIGSELMSLNTIEHLILRKTFKDARIHMALVCASRSCPSLRNEAYTAKTLDIQLDQQCVAFLADPFKNKIHPTTPKISLLFQWYATDFKKSGGIVKFINKYSNLKIRKNARLDYLDYDWSLNEKIVAD